MRPVEGNPESETLTREPPLSLQTPPPGVPPPSGGRWGCLLLSLDLVAAWAID
jgi:hypothetical protein